MHSFDYALRRVGDHGKYQFRVFIIFSITLFTMACQLVSPTYLYIKPDLICDGQVCKYFSLQICKESVETCNSNYDIDPTFQYSNIVTQFNLFCDRSFFISIASSVNFLASVLGGACISYLADNYGRKWTFIWTLFLQALSYIFIYFSKTIYQLIAANFFMGFASFGNYVLMPVIINEICSTLYRQVYTLSLLAVWSIGQILIAIAFYVITDWKTIQLCFIVLPSAVALILSLLILLETPKFYYSKSDREAALVILDMIAQINNEPNLHDNSLDLMENNNEKSSYSIFDLFRYPSLRLPSVGFILISYGLHLLYYGSQYGLSSLVKGELIYQVGVLVGFVELFANLGIIVVIQNLYRKRTVLMSFIISILLCLSFCIFGWKSYAVSCAYCWEQSFLFINLAFTRIAITMGFALQSLWANEFYPTPIRAIGSGFLFAVGVLGSFSAPYILQLSGELELNQYIMIGLVSTPSIVGTLFTVETKGKALKDRIEEEVYDQVKGDEIQTQDD